MRYEDRTFEDETITLDGNEFYRCAFKRCTLIYSGGNVALDPFEPEDCTVRLEGAAQMGHELMMNIFRAGMSASPMGSILQIGGGYWQRVEKPEGFPDS